MIWSDEEKLIITSIFNGKVSDVVSFIRKYVEHTIQVWESSDVILRDEQGESYLIKNGYSYTFINSEDECVLKLQQFRLAWEYLRDNNLIDIINDTSNAGTFLFKVPGVGGDGQFRPSRKIRREISTTDQYRFRPKPALREYIQNKFMTIEELRDWKEDRRDKREESRDTRELQREVADEKNRKSQKWNNWITLGVASASLVVAFLSWWTNKSSREVTLNPSKDFRDSILVTMKNPIIKIDTIYKHDTITVTKYVHLK